MVNWRKLKEKYSDANVHVPSRGNTSKSPFDKRLWQMIINVANNNDGNIAMPVGALKKGIATPEFIELLHALQEHGEIDGNEYGIQKFNEKYILLGYTQDKARAVIITSTKKMAIEMFKDLISE